MNLRCSFCQTPFTLSRIEMVDALQEMDAQKLNHYDAHCPRCLRASAIPRQRLEMAMPNWKDELKKLEVEMKENPQQAAADKLAVQAVMQEHPEFKEFESGQVSGWSHPFTSEEDMDKKYAAFHEALKAKYEEIVSRYTGEDEPIKDDDDEWEQQP